MYINPMVIYVKLGHCERGHYFGKQEITILGIAILEHFSELENTIFMFQLLRRNFQQQFCRNSNA